MQIEQTEKPLCKPMCIVATADNKYAQHLAVTFVSILENNRGDVPKLYVIGDELTTENKNSLSETVKPFGATIEFVQTDVGLYKHLCVSGYFSRATYLKVFVPELLPRDIERVIYLDCDVIVEEDLYDLWNIDISRYHLGAVLDTTLTDRLSILVGEAGMPYFNAGVMLLNLRKWRDDNTVEAVLKFINENNEKLLYRDQDALNAILYKKWLHIEAKWNVQPPMFFCMVKNKSADDISLRYALEKPHIIHYTGRGKPWNYITTYPLRNNYFKHLQLTPWRGFRPRVTPWDIFDGVKLIVKKISPSLFMAVRRMLIKRAIAGSPLCFRICNIFHIELEQ